MTDKEKTLFLFAQTCALLTKDTSSIRGENSDRTGRFAPPKDFDEAYAWLESKLNEKLNSKK
ncbi:hypothetical protein LH413_21400 [Yersinia massiliensis]|uniref:hypothetical protein n=1 Tax=Yersinia massiliensis TaxID=419257 RepID=UPI001CFC9C88|nr:hypothetical protein [Yersinia massiliensis]MCB5320045.1 hypothetical protein [Yersinia massiliensis]